MSNTLTRDMYRPPAHWGIRLGNTLARSMQLFTEALPLSSVHGTYTPVKARFWPCLSGKSPYSTLSCSGFAGKRMAVVGIRPDRPLGRELSMGNTLARSMYAPLPSLVNMALAIQPPPASGLVFQVQV